jgi:phosphohistidine swiveling domain-containing protein
MTHALICWLQDIADDQVSLVGGKAANLGRLLRLGLPVPPGFVVTTAAYRAFVADDNLTEVDPAELRARIADAPIPAAISGAVQEAYQRLGASSVAVRSSATAEDLATASFAGQYDTFLDVTGAEALLQAVRGCWASLWAARAVSYRRERDWDDRELALAVIVQRMVPAEAAGVAFTANPVTGNRAETVISAVRGLGEQLVSGQTTADEWIVRGGEAIRQRAAAEVLTAAQALAVARLARRIADHFGAPQDVEWAISGGEVFVLQARPMTALPAPVEWQAPAPGGWMRHFRLGEWLPEPVTPLFESWLLARIEEGEIAAEAHDFGIRPRPPYHVTVNGWYYSSPIGGGFPVSGVVTLLTRHPLTVVTLVLSLTRPDLADRIFLAARAEAWRSDLLPRYQRLVASWEDRIADAAPAALISLIDAVGDMAGAYLWSLSMVGGHAWKAERALARFYRKHLLGHTKRSHQDLLRGLPTPFPDPPPHAVQSLDWIRPTLGEMVPISKSSGAAEARRQQLEQDRRAAEAECRAALAGRPRLLQRFDAQLALAQRYAIIREEQAGWFTLGWPLLRRGVLRLGDTLARHGVIERAEDVFFLTRGELEAGLDSPPQSQRVAVAARQKEWERQRRLNPPLTLGKAPGAQIINGAAETMRVPSAAGTDSPDVIRGMPASPGRAVGPVRVILGPDDFERLQPGEVLVAQVTTPAWTPLFERAVAVVTDGGSVAAHASLVAREYGIPAVVGTGNATACLRDGQVVLVDGNAGIVEPQRDGARDP